MTEARRPIFWPEQGRDTMNDDHMIHPDCGDTAAEFEGWLNRLVREARHHENQPVDDDHLVAMLDRKARFIAENAGGG